MFFHWCQHTQIALNALCIVVMNILLTGLVAHFMLRGMFDGMDPIVRTGLTLLHCVVPIGTFLDYETAKGLLL